jgi:small subunit ribosomal protein S4
MGRDRKSKHKLSRREGKDLFGTGGESLQRRLDQPPGMHGRKPNRKESVYAEQLREKQKVKRMYGLREDQFQRFMDMALQSREQTGFLSSLSAGLTMLSTGWDWLARARRAVSS